MGSGSSKPSPLSTAATTADPPARRRVASVFNSSCFGFSSTLSDDQVCSQTEEENGMSKGKTCTDEDETVSSGEFHDARRKLSRLARKTDSLVPSNLEFDGKIENMTCQIDAGASSSSAVGRSSSCSSRLRSRLCFNSDGIGFRLNRTFSLGSSSGRTQFSANPPIPSGNAGNGNSSDSLNNTQLNTATSETTASQDVVGTDANFETGVSRRPQMSHSDNGILEMRRSSRRVGLHEALEGSVRFSRTRSVGRLRDRVLRGTSLSDGILGPIPPEVGTVAYSGQSNGRRVLGPIRRTQFSSERINASPWSNTTESSGGQASETPHHDLLEHRSAFLERRRRIRSQVRALQRLGSRFENLSGHDRSCILSGQHRTGRCTCRINRPANADEDISTRASISRIVMLAEALFEVLDEIHQQSVVLSSRPSFSTIGSVPAPKEAVECLPVKIYMKPQKHHNEDAEQCYICLLEYEEGDCMRILPCKHGFHQLCVDKWLKEIHRVCPLCRGDVCSTDATNMGKLS